MVDDLVKVKVMFRSAVFKTTPYVIISCLKKENNVVPKKTQSGLCSGIFLDKAHWILNHK